MSRYLFAPITALLLASPLMGAESIKPVSSRGLIHIQVPRDAQWELTTKDNPNTLKMYIEGTDAGGKVSYSHVATVKMDNKVFPVEYVTHDQAAPVRILKAGTGYVVGSLPDKWELRLGIFGSGTCILKGEFKGKALSVKTEFLPLDGKIQAGPGPGLTLSSGKPSGEKTATEFTLKAR